MSAAISIVVLDDANRVAKVDGFEVPFRTDFEDGKPRVRDVDYARWLGYARPADIRELIKRMIRDGKLNDVHQVRVARKWEGQVAARPVDEFWLTRTEALLLATQSETPRAWSMTETIVDVFEAVLDDKPTSPAQIEAARDRELRALEAGFLDRALDALKAAGQLSPANEATWRITAAEHAFGKSLLALRPQNDQEQWETPTEIAERHGVTTKSVGAVITQLGIRTNVPGFVESYQTNTPGTKRVVTCWRYSPAAVAQIDAALRGSR